MNTKGNTQAPSIRKMPETNTSLVEAEVRRRDMLKKIRMMSSEEVLALGKPKEAKVKVLVPLSGKVRPTKNDMETLKEDREVLEMMAVSILENKRLAFLIVSAWLEECHCVMVPQQWLDEKLHGTTA